jgi:hypothetical protein
MAVTRILSLTDKLRLSILPKLGKTAVTVNGTATPAPPGEGGVIRGSLGGWG